ncbi:MAG TPA: NfeD family protein [Gaiellaceae bacterium]|nr:NfeD family protein [Gaiellaceae bacterium]
MPDWAIWIVAAAALAGVEALTLVFLCGPLAVAALLAAAVAAAGASVVVQLGVFVAGSVASLLVLRPIARRHLRSPGQLRSGTAGLVGATAVVLERVDGENGLVKLAGETWTARSFDDARAFEPGERVSVLQIEGATALVSDY